MRVEAIDARLGIEDLQLLRGGVAVLYAQCLSGLGGCSLSANTLAAAQEEFARFSSELGLKSMRFEERPLLGESV